MSDPDASPERAVLELVDTVLRAAGDLSRLGDMIASRQGQTAARSLVLGALAGAPGPIADVARQRGLRRQSVQETMGRLERDGLVVRDTSSSRRSPTFRLTEQGRRVREDLDSAFSEWGRRVALELTRDEIAQAVRAVRALTAETR